MFENRENLFYLKLPTRNYSYFHRKTVSSCVFYKGKINYEGTFKKVFDIRLAAGIVLIIRSALGTTPISSINYVLSLNSSLSLGTCTFIINMLLIIGQFWLIRNNKSKRDIIEILLQLPFSFIFSAFIDLNMFLTNDLHPSNYGMAIALLLFGCLVQSIGVVLEIKPHVAMMSAEGFVKYASRSCNKEFGKFKVYFDVTLVTSAVILSLILSQRVEGVREGSIIAACITGYLVSFLNQKIMTQKTLHKLRSIIIR